MWREIYVGDFYTENLQVFPRHLASFESSGGGTFQISCQSPGHLGCKGCLNLQEKLLLVLPTARLLNLKHLWDTPTFKTPPCPRARQYKAVELGMQLYSMQNHHTVTWSEHITVKPSYVLHPWPHSGKYFTILSYWLVSESWFCIVVQLESKLMKSHIPLPVPTGNHMCLPPIVWQLKSALLVMIHTQHCVK